MTDLSDIRNHLYQTAEDWWIRSLVFSVITLLISVFALWYTTAVWVGVAGVISIIAPVAITWMREIASTCMLKGDKCRRLILYADGLGTEIPADELAQVRAWRLGCELREAPFVRPYYSSDRLPGAQRLADIVAESAFFTHHLASKLSAGLWASFVCALILSCIVLYFADFMESGGPGSLIPIAKSVAVFVAFLIAGDFLLIAKKFSDLKNDAHQTLTRCVHLRSGAHIDTDEVRSIVEDYGISLLQAPPIPGKLYLHYRDELNEIYRDSHFHG